MLSVNQKPIHTQAGHIQTIASSHTYKFDSQGVKSINKRAAGSDNNQNRQVQSSRGQAKTEVYLGLLEVTAYSEHGPVASDGSMSGLGKVAVDPLCIPYGTKLYIEGYGYAIAADSGLLIKGITPGNKLFIAREMKYERLANIDVWFSTKAEALKWGRRVVKVYRLE